MNRNIAVSLIAGAMVSALALYLAFRNVPLADLMTYLGQIDYFWVLPTVVLCLSTFILRVWRWQIILKDNADIGFWDAFHPLMIGFMMNCILPGRVGELARPALLKKQRSVALTTGLATVAAERVFDVMFLIGLFALVFSHIARASGSDVSFGGYVLNQQTLQTIAWGLVRLCIVLVVMLSALAVTAVRMRIIRFIKAVGRVDSQPQSLFGRALAKTAACTVQLIENFALGLRLVYYPGRLLGCLALSAAIWALTAVSYYVFAMGVPGVQLTMWQATTVMVIICFFIALPSVPGFWGLWEAGGVFALSLFGIGAKQAAGFTLVNHAAQIVPVIVVGMISAMITSVNIFRLPREEKISASAM